MIKTLALLLAGLLAATAARAEAPTLRARVVVADDLVRIGDFIANAGPAGGIAIFRAPDPGTTGSVGVDQVLDAVRAHGLQAVDTRGLSEVEVSRRSRIIAPDDIKLALANAIAARGVARAKDLTIALDQPPALQVEETARAALQVSHLAFDPRSGRFDATMVVPDSELARRQPARVTGTAVVTIEAVVLARPVGRGEVLRASDLITERRPRTELGVDGFIAPDSAIGLAPRRALAAGHQLRAADVMKPDLISRNDIVTLVFEAPGVSVSTRGRANSSGAEGDAIAVTNLQSKRIVQGVVTASGTVSVSAGPAVISGDATVTGSVPANRVRTQTIRPPTAEPQS